MSARWRLEARRRNGELWVRFHGAEGELREQARVMATIHGQKHWKYDLYLGGTLKATLHRGVWTEHGEGKA
jgi:hypothetical protein